MNIRKFRNWVRRNAQTRRGGVRPDSESIREVLNGKTDSVLMAFSWHRTPQGSDYWDAVHDGTRKIGKNGRRFLVLLEKRARELEGKA